MKNMSIKVADELHRLIKRRAGKGQMIDVIVRILGEHFERPDLCIVPRQKRGPKCKGKK